MRYPQRAAALGVFALTASAAGTMGLEELKRLQAYLVAYASAALLLAATGAVGFMNS